MGPLSTIVPSETCCIGRDNGPNLLRPMNRPGAFDGDHGAALTLSTLIGRDAFTPEETA